MQYEIMCIQLHSLSTPIKSYTLTVNANANEDILLNSIFHRASKTTNLLVLFLYIILYPHSLHLIGSLDFISFSVWHSPHIYIIGCCFGGWTSFWVFIIRLRTKLLALPDYGCHRILEQFKKNMEVRSHKWKDW